MRPRARTGLLAAALLLMPAVPAAADTAPPPPAPIASMALRDGRVLHNVKIMSDEGASIVVRADEGLVQIEKSNLPQGVADAFPKRAPAPETGADLVMQRFDPNQAPEAPPPEPGGAKPKPKPAGIATPAPAPVANAVYKGCTIVSFQKKSFENVLGCAEVIIQNDSEENTQIRPGDFVCITADGVRHPGRNIFANTFPPSVKRREFVPAHLQLDDIITFGNEDLDIASVQWAR
jgi:hypothetical protein